MTQRIIYQTENGGVVVIIPAPQAVAEIGIEEIARKDVPAGSHFAIINTEDIPSDRTFRAAWEVEHGNLNDGIGTGQKAWFIEKHQAEIEAVNSQETPVRAEEQTDEQYADMVAQFEETKAARIAQLQAMIAIQQAEMNQ